MPKAKRSSAADRCCGCKVEALIRIDDRGQMVLPKDVREKAGIHDGDKLALTTVEKDGRICCLILTSADDLGATVRTLLDDATRGGSGIEEGE